MVTYRIPKEKDPVPAAVAVAGSPHAAPGAAAAAPADSGASMASTPVATATGAALTWTAPARWVAKPASAMRKGSYTIAGEGGATADLAITAFPGDVGGEAANVNRWRGQLGLPALPETAAPAALQRIEAHGLKLAVLDVPGTASGAPGRLLGAMVPFDGATWFFKLTGPDALVAAEKAAFLEFLASVQPTAATP